MLLLYVDTAMSATPVYQEIPYIAPHKLFAAIADKTNDILFLDRQTTASRYAFLAWDPIKTVPDNVDPFEWLDRQDYQLEAIPDLPPFQTGWAGYLSYEAGCFVEDIPVLDRQMPLYHIGLFDVVLAFDCLHQKAWIIASGYSETDELHRKNRASDRINETLDFLASLELDTQSKNDYEPLKFSKPNETVFKAAVEKTIKYIYAGDIFQANISHRVKTALPTDYNLVSLFGRLRQHNPAPHGAYYSFDNYTILSCSPETFIKVQDQKISTKPIKGTAASTDGIALQQSLKNRSENLMIVDLLRNDLSRVCVPGSVQVPKLFALEHYPNLCHLVSTVVGQLSATPIAALKACYPGGSITGAPKVRAMELVVELEQKARNAYCGSLFYLGHDNTLDSSLLIRTLYGDRHALYLHAGCGIVADSESQDEYEESLRKIAKILEVC